MSDPTAIISTGGTKDSPSEFAAVDSAQNLTDKDRLLVSGFFTGVKARDRRGCNHTLRFRLLHIQVEEDTDCSDHPFIIFSVRVDTIDDEVPSEDHASERTSPDIFEIRDTKTLSSGATEKTPTMWCKYMSSDLCIGEVAGDLDAILGILPKDGLNVRLSISLPRLEKVWRLEHEDAWTNMTHIPSSVD